MMSMAKRTFHLNEKEKNRFRQREAASDDTSEMKRLQAVRLYGGGRAVADIMDVTGCTESSLRRWAQQYREQGLSGLRTDYSAPSQNSRKLSEAQCAAVQQRLHHYRPDQILAPAMRIETGQFWTVSDLAIAVEHWYGVVYQDRGLTNIYQAFCVNPFSFDHKFNLLITSIAEWRDGPNRCMVLVCRSPLLE
ncbi:MAG: helix-turn-helix domain-containing protein [Anaerolineae bacterium]|nr:helix-turn-helix domain-containing protein [Anaerolineae bacterium]